jgi:hypothetical protein
MIPVLLVITTMKLLELKPLWPISRLPSTLNYIAAIVTPVYRENAFAQ